MKDIHNLPKPLTSLDSQLYTSCAEAIMAPGFKYLSCTQIATVHMSSDLQGKGTADAPCKERGARLHRSLHVRIADVIFGLMSNIQCWNFTSKPVIISLIAD